MAEKKKSTKKKATVAKKVKAAVAESKGFNLALVPPVPTLQLATVAVVDHRMDEFSRRLNMSSDLIRKAALIYRELCRGGACFLCGNALDEKQIASLDEKHVDDMMPCKCLDKHRDGYIEYWPNWRRQTAQIIRDVAAIEADPSSYDPNDTTKFAKFTVLFSNKCIKCAVRFDTDAEVVARYIKKFGKFEPFSRCPKCGKARKEEVRRLNDARSRPRPVNNAPIAEKPHRQPRKTTLTATVAEHVDSKTEAKG